MATFGRKAYCICVIQMSVRTWGRLIRILSRATLRSSKLTSGPGYQLLKAGLSDYGA